MVDDVRVEFKEEDGTFHPLFWNKECEIGQMRKLGQLSECLWHGFDFSI